MRSDVCTDNMSTNFVWLGKTEKVKTEMCKLIPHLVKVEHIDLKHSNTLVKIVLPTTFKGIPWV